MSAKKIVAHQQIFVWTVYKKINNYKKFCEKSFELNSKERKKEPVNENFKKIVKKEWQKFQCGSVKIHWILTNNQRDLWNNRSELDTFLQSSINI